MALAVFPMDFPTLQGHPLLYLIDLQLKKRPVYAYTALLDVSVYWCIFLQVFPVAIVLSQGRHQACHNKRLVPNHEQQVASGWSRRRIPGTRFRVHF